jgi:uncharacterized protein (TIGR02231 family)
MEFIGILNQHRKQTEIMRTIFITILALLAAKCTASSQKTSEAKVDKATVYMQGAMLYSTNIFQLSQGMNECVFLNTSPLADAASLTASGKGNFTIMEVHALVDYPEPKAPKKGPHPLLKALIAVNDSLKDNEMKQEELNEKLSVLNNEKSLIQNNRLLKGETKRDTLALVKDAVEYYRNRLNNIVAEQTKIKRELRQLNERISSLRQRIDDMNGIISSVPQNSENITPLHKTVVTVMATAASQAEITIGYFVASAGWSPQYDLKAGSSSKNVSVIQTAKVYQNSGLDWTQTRLTLSTGQPQTSLEKPLIQSAYLSIINNRNHQVTISGSAMNKGLADAPASVYRVESEKTTAVEDAADYSLNYTESADHAVVTEYEIKLKYNIPSNNKPHWVSIQEKELKSFMEYATAPVQDAGVFLMAHLTGWESLDMLTGPARVFLDGAFVGNTTFNPQSVSDTLSMSLGRDRTWSVSRKKIKEKKSDKILAEEKSVVLEYEIQLRNNHTKDSEISLEDRIPLSAQNQISVKLLDSSGAEYDAQTGILKWSKKVKAQETTKVRFSYEVRYPANSALAGL